MSSYSVAICDLCKVEHRSDKPRYWADTIADVEFNFKKHAGVQYNIEKALCTDCARKILETITDKMKELTK